MFVSSIAPPVDGLPGPDEENLLSRLDQLVGENAHLRFELEWRRRIGVAASWLAWFSSAGLVEPQAVWWVSRNRLQQEQAYAPRAELINFDRDQIRSTRRGEISECAIFASPDSPPHPRRKQNVVAVGGNQGVLVFEEWPVVAGDEIRDRQLICRLAGELAFATESSAPSALPEFELELVRDMLELRALTDREFRSPQEMLDQFLDKLLVLTGLERASLFLDDAVTAGQLERVASVGHGRRQENLNAHVEWEHRTIRTAVEAIPAVPVDGVQELSLSWLFPPLVRAGLLASICERDERRGWLLLSSSTPCRFHESDRELIRWAGQFLLTTLSRAEDRAQLETRARRDSLTGLANRQTFETEFEKLLAHCAQDRRACSLLVVDVDHFKSVNDTWGHQTGDCVLREVAQRLACAAEGNRVTDRPLVGRFGGEEFVVLLPEVERPGALRIAQELRQAIGGRDIELPSGERLHVTASLGLACAPDHGASTQRLFAAADSALYAAKRNGRNRVELAQGYCEPLPAKHDPSNDSTCRV